RVDPQLTLYHATSLRLRLCCSPVSVTPAYRALSATSWLQRSSASAAVETAEKTSPAQSARPKRKATALLARDMRGPSVRAASMRREWTNPLRHESSRIPPSG